MSSPNPYESPAIPEGESLPAKSALSDEEYDCPLFRSPRLLGVICICLFALIILHSAMDVYLEIDQYLLQHEIPDDERDAEAISASFSWQGIMSAIAWPLSLTAHLCLIAWTYRCHRNLESLGHRKLDSKHIWAVLCWFIPILNLFCPFQVMREIWWRSYPLAKNSAETAPASHLVFWWWLLKVTAVLTAYIAYSFSSYETWPQYHTFLRTFLLSYGCDIVAALLAIIMIHRISQWQTSRYQLLQESAAAST